MTDKIFSQVQWGIIGAGNVCEVKSGPAFNNIPQSKLLAVMRRNAEKAKDFAFRHKVPKWYDNADQLINDPDVNAIYIATPPESHKEYTLKAAAAGKPVYVEKPMARTHGECLQMISACQQAGVPLFVAYYRRRLPIFLKIKELVDQNMLGDIRFIDIKLNKTLRPDIVGASGDKNNWRVFPEMAGGGYFYDLASHQLDFLDYVFGPITEAKGFAANQAGLYPAEDIVSGSFRFGNGILGQGTWCFTTSSVSNLEETRIVGSKGQLYFSYFGGRTITLEREGKRTEIFAFDSPKHIQQPLIQTVVNELLGKGVCPSSGESGARTNQVMEWLCQKADK